jgi:hypothetical protein
MYRQLVHEYGNGRAVENTRRDTRRDRFTHERIEAVVRRLNERPAGGHDRAGAA